MLFNSYLFILIFLPMVLIGFGIIGRLGHHKVAISWLVASSLLFYGWWNPLYVWLLLMSVLFNYAIGVALLDSNKKVFLVLGIAVNIALLGYFKYANFFIDNVNYILKSNFSFDDVILPLAISFFTFQQITYLIDAYNGKTKEYSFLHYLLFVTFFPQLIAGPIVHHKEMMPQFCNDFIYKINARNISIGITIFFIGLFKKVVIADNLATYATPVFNASELGLEITFLEAWAGAIAYSFQLYFDFSGYSEMALGIARMFGIILPVNFFSPFKATNIADFWRRWHITLSNFIKDYLFYPVNIVMTRYAILNKYNKIGEFLITVLVPMMIAWFLAGLWHGSNWTFVIFGLMHGCYLIVYRIYLDIRYLIFSKGGKSGIFSTALLRMFMFFIVTMSFVMFRSESVNGAISMYKSMVGGRGISVSSWFESKMAVLGDIPNILGVRYDGFFYNGILTSNPENLILFLAFLFFIVWFSPNVIELFRLNNPALGVDVLLKNAKNRILWNINIYFLIATVILSVVSIMFVQQESEFIYFNF
ncbi:MBOAT family protein [Candidatus Woesearchaeota archaeon]|jgi:alginate O-acetyltransferase complex protein AlgI|nr:MBOAT family protein [Candidatus Woesearchaeota archaeon]